MTSTSTSEELDQSFVHRACLAHWADLEEQLHVVPPWEWPERITPWLLHLAEPLGATAEADPDQLSRLTSALALVNALGRLHRSRTGAFQDAFRAVRDRLLRSIRQILSPQEVLSLLDTVEYEARSLEHAFLADAA